MVLKRWSVGVAQLFHFPKRDATFCVLKNGRQKTRGNHAGINVIIAYNCSHINNKMCSVRMVYN